MNSAHKTTSHKETQKLAEELAETLRGGEVIALYGDLGSGKTTFAQGLAQALGIRKHIKSPTFIIHRTYRIKNLPAGRQGHESRIERFHHIDLYRIETEHALSSLGLEELLQQKDAVTVIEWPEKMADLLPSRRIDVQFTYRGENEREIVIK